MNTDSNFPVFRECLSAVIVESQRSEGKPSKTSRRRKSKQAARDLSPPRAGPEDLAEFTDFLASESFPSLPPLLQTLSYSAIQHNPSLAETYAAPLPQQTLNTVVNSLPPAVTDSLVAYAIVPDLTDVRAFIHRALVEYISAVTAPPPVWASTRPDACEICDRDWIPLSYHHLIPRAVHDKVRRKGWHEEWMLNSVAWLCRACHSFVHRMASNEELAREWFTVDRILERDDVKVWAKWVGRVRWKTR